MIMASNENSRKLFLGLDFSTQQAKAVIIDDDLNVLQEAAVHFDSALPEFRTNGGVIKHDDGATVTVSTIMWVKALDILLEKLKISRIDFSSIEAISGTGQQHGSVYWKNNASDIISKFDPGKFLHSQFQGCFSIRNSPIWMDSSSTKQCRALEHSLGGPQTLTDITGSRAYERFTGNQIAKIHETMQDAYNKTERISLVSSFIATILLGKYADIDLSDGSGMNLLNIHSKNWSNECLNGCAPNLREKLGDVVPSSTVLGNISTYFSERYGFKEDCKIIAFTGDNPASLAGMRLTEGDIAVSLGTSDTLFVWIKEPHPSLEGHIFVNPVDENQYMGLLCFKNGSFTRERLRNEAAESSWDLFNQLLNATPRGNFGNIGMYYDYPEIIPDRIIGDFRFNKMNEKVLSYSKEVEVRALVEGQFLRLRSHAEDLGFEVGSNSKVLVTGGGSKNSTLVQVLCDIFNAPVYSLDVANSACLGSAYRARHGLIHETDSGCSFTETVKNAPYYTLLAEPNKDAAEVYGPMVDRYRTLENVVVEKFKSKQMQ